MIEKAHFYDAHHSNSTKVLLWVILGVVEIVSVIVLCNLGLGDYILPCMFSACALGVAAWMNWSFHTKPWFWAILCVFTALHIPLAFYWGKNYPIKGHIDGRGVAAMAFADAAFITAYIRFPYWIINTAEWLMKGDGEGTVSK